MRVSRGELDAPESSWAISMLIHASQRQFRLSRDEREMMQTFNTFSKDEHERFRSRRANISWQVRTRQRVRHNAYHSIRRIFLDSKCCQGRAPALVDDERHEQHRRRPAATTAFLPDRFRVHL